MNFRAILVDDHEIVRKGLRQIIHDEFFHSEIEEAACADEAIRMIRHQKFDLVISDITMPGRSGLELLKQIHQEFPSLPVLILSIHREDQYAIRALKAGASGYLAKDSASLELIKAIRQVLSGRKYISPTVGELLAGGMSDKQIQYPHELLSDREFEVMKLIGNGKSVSEIAEQLSLSVATISTYRTRILEKVQLSSNADIIRYTILLNLG